MIDNNKNNRKMKYTPSRIEIAEFECKDAICAGTLASSITGSDATLSGLTGASWSTIYSDSDQ